jgi:hypothetical protein
MFAIFAFGIFTRSAGSENVRTIQIITLITAGFGLGVGFINLLLKHKEEDSDQ